MRISVLCFLWPGFCGPNLCSIIPACTSDSISYPLVDQYGSFKARHFPFTVVAVFFSLGDTTYLVLLVLVSTPDKRCLTAVKCAALSRCNLAASAEGLDLIYCWFPSAAVWLGKALDYFFVSDHLKKSVTLFWARAIIFLVSSSPTILFVWRAVPGTLIISKVSWPQRPLLKGFPVSREEVLGRECRAVSESCGAWPLWGLQSFSVTNWKHWLINATLKFYQNYSGQGSTCL